MLMLQVAQNHIEQGTSRSIRAHSTFAVPACLAASLPQAYRLAVPSETPKQPWQTRPGKNFCSLNYCGYELDIVSPCESSAGGLPFKKR